jgi:LppX_LprAFG lipoprotein
MIRKLHLAPLVPLLALAACAQPSDDPQRVDAGAADELRSAPDAIAEAETARLEMTAEVVGPDGEPFTISSSGAFDRAAEQLSIALEPGGPLELGPMQLVVDGDDAYVGTSLLREELTWYSVPADQLQASTGDLFDRTTQDPTSVLEVLRGVSDDVTTVGTEEVRGEGTTHYTATVDVAEALAAATPESRDALGAQVDDLLGGLESIPVDVWVGDDGLVHRFQVAVEGQGAEATLTLELFDHGDDVEIEIPAREDVQSFDGLLGAWGVEP